MKELSCVCIFIAAYYKHMPYNIMYASLIDISEIAAVFRVHKFCVKLYILFTSFSIDMLLAYIHSFIDVVIAHNKIAVAVLYDLPLFTLNMTTRSSLTHWATWDYYECLNIDILRRLDHFTSHNNHYMCVCIGRAC